PAAAVLEVGSELLAVATGDAANRLPRRIVAHLEAAQPLARVVREVGLALLAVVHDVDAVGYLLAHAVGDGAGDAPRDGGFVVGPPLVPRPGHLPEVGRSRQAADVRRQDALRAALQFVLPYL